LYEAIYLIQLGNGDGQGRYQGNEDKLFILSDIENIILTWFISAVVLLIPTNPQLPTQPTRKTTLARALGMNSKKRTLELLILKIILLSY
jgi:hypothetical protein